MRLDKFLADMGMGARSELRKRIRQQQVSVDGTVVRDPGYALQDPESAVVCVNGERVRYESLVYYMMNKPAGVLSAAEDKRQTTVVDLIREGENAKGRPVRTDLFPVGRLDKDTEGLLLITNDGALAHRLLMPASHVDKVYYVEAAGRITGQDAERFRKGIRYDENLTALPAQLRILPDDAGKPGISRLEVTIHEGKFHQIRKMIRALGDGKEVVYLKRLSMGALRLDPALAPGAYRRLTQEERELL